MSSRLLVDRAGTAGGIPTKGACDDKVALAALAGVTLMVAGVETARAGLVTQTETFTIGPTSSNGKDVLTFNMFDPSQGALTGVSFVLTSATNTSVTIDVNPGIEVSEGGATNTSSFSVVVESPNLTAFQTTGLASASCTGTFQCSNTGASGASPFNGAYVVPSVDVAGFVGLGSIMVDLNYANSLMVTSCQYGGCSPSGTLTWADAPGTLEIEYQTADVPEPSTWALFGTGFVSVAGLWRMRRASRRNATLAA
jgi:hypothetical protein